MDRIIMYCIEHKIKLTSFAKVLIVVLLSLLMHLIVREDLAPKKAISPITNHNDTIYIVAKQCDGDTRYLMYIAKQQNIFVKLVK